MTILVGCHSAFKSNKHCQCPYCEKAWQLHWSSYNSHQIHTLDHEASDVIDICTEKYTNKHHRMSDTSWRTSQSWKVRAKCHYNGIWLELLLNLTPGCLLNKQTSGAMHHTGWGTVTWPKYIYRLCMWIWIWTTYNWILSSYAIGEGL